MNDETTDSYTTFRQWLDRNMHIYQRFKHYAFQLINAGRKHPSAHFVIHRVRCDTELRAEGDHDDRFKIRNDWFPYLAREFHRRNPDLRVCPGTSLTAA